jgi:hypothetical protein
MEPVNGLGPLSQLLRQKAGASEASAPQRESGAADAAGSPAVRTAVEDIERRVRLKLKDLGPGAGKSAGFRRWVISLVLTYEYNPRVQTEPKFVAMVQSVLRALEGDAGLQERFDSVMDELSRN